MDSASTVAGESVTKTKTTPFKVKKLNENVDPNISNSSIRLKLSDSPSVVKSEKSGKKSAQKSSNPNPNPDQVLCASPSPMLKKKIRERKFVVAKKKKSARNQVVCEKCKTAIGKSKCLCLAYQSLRASHEEFFKNRIVGDEDEVDCEVVKGEMEGSGEGKEVENGEMSLKRSRDKLLESGRVMHLVEAFEKLTVPKVGDSEEEQVDVDGGSKEVEWALPGMQQPTTELQTQVSSSSFCPSDFLLTSESLGLDSHRSQSLDGSQGSFLSRTSDGDHGSRRSSNESAATYARRQWRRKQRKATSQKPFMLKTEERGRMKEEEFLKKLQQTLEEEEKLRIPIAQGLPWTTDEPQCLPKPPVKESTKPIDLVLHSDVRAVERSEFDCQVAEKMNLIEQYRMEREMRQKLAEEEEIKRLRKVLVPRAQPMPYFDRPFIPRRSEKHPTIPKEPKFHIPHHKKIKCYTSLDDFYAPCQ